MSGPDLDLVKQLLDAKADPNIGVSNGTNVSFQHNSYPLILAQSKQSNDAAHTKLLIKYGANVNAQDNNGVTALNHALSFNNKESITALLDAGADPTFLTFANMNSPILKQIIADRKQAEYQAKIIMTGGVVASIAAVSYVSWKYYKKREKEKKEKEEQARVAADKKAKTEK